MSESLYFPETDPLRKEIAEMHEMFWIREAAIDKKNTDQEDILLARIDNAPTEEERNSRRQEWMSFMETEMFSYCDRSIELDKKERKMKFRRKGPMSKEKEEHQKAYEKELDSQDEKNVKRQKEIIREYLQNWEDVEMRVEKLRTREKEDEEMARQERHQQIKENKEREKEEREREKQTARKRREEEEIFKKEIEEKREKEDKERAKVQEKEREEEREREREKEVKEMKTREKEEQERRKAKERELERMKEMKREGEMIIEELKRDSKMEREKAEETERKRRELDGERIEKMREMTEKTRQELKKAKEVQKALEQERKMLNSDQAHERHQFEDHQPAAEEWEIQSYSTGEHSLEVQSLYEENLKTGAFDLHEASQLNTGTNGDPFSMAQREVPVVQIPPQAEASLGVVKPEGKSVWDSVSFIPQPLWFRWPEESRPAIAQNPNPATLSSSHKPIGERAVSISSKYHAIQPSDNQSGTKHPGANGARWLIALAVLAAVLVGKHLTKSEDSKSGKKKRHPRQWGIQE